MKLNEKYDETGGTGVGGATEAEAPALYSEAWWATLTADELQDYLKRGFAAGDVFYAAVAESNRREWEIMERERQKAALEAEIREKESRRHAIRVSLGVAAVIIFAAIGIVLII